MYCIHGLGYCHVVHAYLPGICEREIRLVEKVPADTPHLDNAHKKT